MLPPQYDIRTAYVVQVHVTCSSESKKKEKKVLHLISRRDKTRKSATNTIYFKTGDDEFVHPAALPVSPHCSFLFSTMPYAIALLLGLLIEVST